MPIIKPNSYPNSVALTITLASLASTTADPPVGRESLEVAQDTDLALDVLLDGKITTGTTPTAAKQIQILAWGAGYDGTTVRRAAGATGTDAGLTPGSWWKDVLFPVLTINTSSTSNVTYTFAGISLLKVFGGLFMPVRWGVFVHHNTGVLLNATAGNHEIRATKLQNQVV
jgi:hypothetical protein